MPDGNICCVPDCVFERDGQRLPEREPYDGELYCIFHAPPELKRTWGDPMVAAFGTKLNEYIRHANIRDFDSISIPSNVVLPVDGIARNQHIRFSNCLFLGSTKFTVNHHTLGDCQILDSKFLASCEFDFVSDASKIAFVRCEVFGPFKIGSTADRALRRVDVIDLAGSTFFAEVTLSGFSVNDAFILESIHLTEPPDFRDLIIPQDSRFSDLRCAETAYSKRAEPSFRTIRQQLANTDARDFEGMFYCFEQRCARQRYPKMSMRRMVSALYDFSTEYGTNYVRVFAILLGTQVLSWAVYLRLNYIAWHVTDWPLATRFAAAQLFRPFEIFSLSSIQSTAINCLFGNGWPAIAAEVAAGLQTVLSLVALTLFLLALRWRFRRTVT